MTEAICPFSFVFSHSKNKYFDMFIQTFSNGFQINNPPFGSSYQVVVAEEMQLNGFSSDIKSVIRLEIKRLNKKVK